MELKPLDQVIIPRGKIPPAAGQQNNTERAAVSETTNAAVVKSINTTRPKTQIFETRNNLISISNIATEGIKDAAQVVASLTPGVAPGPVKQKLETIANRQAPDGRKPLTGESLRLSSGNGTTSAQFPDDLVTGFGLSQEKEPSEETIAEVRERLEKFRARSEEILRSIRDSIASLDVAEENSAAAEVSVRELDAASALAEDTGLSVSLASTQALQANNLNPNSLVLLE